ncbi:acyl-CoA dehydrogenase [candidate division WOR-1 bacterium RIFOXYA12_FULL_43_27]|uniref:Acyl-CoA dehydrogenase n=1 Tax=candidate division WOR-1 bacterium RIFOXYC2_FULL_46_14 TaxID=1802587 RepID=A0A1F4U407_UNCSA|nr:MAG: acyl-CoA dehydrogenase [candidate division WOR-1 bacterium RIFOXYA12_FULL_43_27]OGC18948.1 MAG: acyl-CoA dehydrogenase [candidate division WOR-1 bacterium RIFOXYB2_FULL_46_45]OGC29090.1 MAG: acyl-CoA dehydrogenase [candidate division WOR-1 bacterium RIFOXYA2_FULL_46_56]OGC39704.1 MAG: acyl-CoA dehydrogenase [candidate division WOR-1 bacterium RIFOXYC2_FULL_46_14]
MDYGLTEEQLMIRELARKIALEKGVPVREKLDETGEFPWEIMKVFAESDLCGLYIDEKYGGTGMGELAFCLATEEISRICGGIGVTFAASALGASPIVLYGSEEQKKKYLPDIAAGKKLAAFGLTEANAGSDAAGMETTATKDGDHYILNGTKQWITNGGEADTYSVIAISDRKKGSRGATAFILEKGMPGFTFGKKENKMGIRCSATRELVFQGCKVPKENVIAKEGMGFIVAMKTLDMTRPGIGAQAVGIAQGALDEAIKYAKQRVQFGKPIITLQAIQHMLADMATQIEAARSLVYSVARAIDNGSKDFTKEAAMCKLFASDTAMRVTTDAVQILGGYGYMKEYPVEKMMRDAKITQIYEGTNQIQRNQIGLGLIKEAAKK